MQNLDKDLTQRVSADCQSWIPTGTSLIAQHPTHDRENLYQYTNFILSYSADFLSFDSSVKFKFRASQQ
jgi:hypothetical protein